MRLVADSEIECGDAREFAEARGRGARSSAPRVRGRVRKRTASAAGAAVSLLARRTPRRRA
jgi:hypothetical protein